MRALCSAPWRKTTRRSPKIVSRTHTGTATAHMQSVCTQIGTFIAAAVVVASVPPNPGKSRDVIKNAGDPIRRRRANGGNFATIASMLTPCVAWPAIQYPRIAANIRPMVSMIDPQKGPKIAPFITASASVTENGADATSANSAIAEGIEISGPMVRMKCSTRGWYLMTRNANANERTSNPMPARRRYDAFKGRK